jgi:hypothetical protein
MARIDRLLRSLQMLSRPHTANRTPHILMRTSHSGHDIVERSSNTYTVAITPGEYDKRRLTLGCSYEDGKSRRWSARIAERKDYERV